MTRLGAYIRRNHLALVALVIAVIGVPTAWALGRNTIGSGQIKPGAVRSSDIKDGAVTSTKVRDGSLHGSDFAAGQLPATLFAFIQDGAGKPVVGYGDGVKGVSEPNGGEYLVQFNRDLSGCAAGAASGLGAPLHGGAGANLQFAYDLEITGANNDAVDVTFSNAMDTSFFITVTC
jgi:hypothetical protein